MLEVHKTFGFELPRNSGQQGQSEIGENLHFPPDASAGDRMRALAEADIGDLLYSPGHVMLYIGRSDGEPYVIHDLLGAGWIDDDGGFHAGVLNGVSVTPLMRIHSSPEHTYFERERPVVEAIRGRFIKELEAGNDVVLDHGLWRRAERDAWRQTAREAGGHPLVVYLPADRQELLRRLDERNQREDANALTVTPEALDDFFARFEPPADDEEVITYSGDLGALLAALSAVRRG